MSKTFSYSVLIKVVDQASGPFGKMARNLKKTTQGIHQVSRGLDKMVGKLSAVGAKAGAFGNKWKTSVTLPVAAFGGMAIRTAMKFEDSMNMTQAVTKATAKEMENLRDKAKEMGATTQFRASDAGEAMVALGKAGLGVDEIYSALPRTLELAGSAQLDMGTAADIVANIMGGYGKTAEELKEVNDNLVGAFTAAKTDLQSLGEAFKFVGPVAKSSGQSFRDTTIALAAMAQGGFEGAMGGTALRRVFSGLLNPTKEAKNAMNELHIKQKDVYKILPNGKKQLKSVLELFTLFKEKGMDAAAAMKMFGLRGGPGLIAALGVSDEKIRKITEAVDDNGIAARIQDANMRGLPGTIRRLASAYEALQLEISGEGGLDTIFTKGAKGATAIMQKFMALDNQTKKNVVNFTLLGAAVPLAGIGISGLTKAIALAVAGFKALAAAGMVVGGPILLGLGAMGVALYYAYENAELFLGAFKRIGDWIDNKGKAFDEFFGIKRGKVDRWHAGLKAQQALATERSEGGTAADTQGPVFQSLKDMAHTVSPTGGKNNAEILVKIVTDAGLTGSIQGIKNTGTGGFDITSQSYVGAE